MPKDRESEADLVVARAERASVWIPWYFKRGALTIITAPLFLLLIFCVAISVLAAAIQGFALIRVSYAVFGIIGLLLVISFGWIPVILPPVLYYSLVKNLPGLWLRPDASTSGKIMTSLAVIALLPLVAYLVYQGAALGIGWIADRDPCAAFAVGVTGSVPPGDCP